MKKGGKTRELYGLRKFCVFLCVSVCFYGGWGVVFCADLAAIKRNSLRLSISIAISTSISTPISTAIPTWMPDIDPRFHFFLFF